MGEGGVTILCVGFLWGAPMPCPLGVPTGCALLYGLRDEFILVVLSDSILCGVILLFIIGGQLAPPMCKLQFGLTVGLLAVVRWRSGYGVSALFGFRSVRYSEWLVLQ